MWGPAQPLTSGVTWAPQIISDTWVSLIVKCVLHSHPACWSLRVDEIQEWVHIRCIMQQMLIEHLLFTRQGAV